MLIRSVRLNDYRNYDRAVFTFDPHLNIIIGKNGTGKTNLLESVTVVSNTRSYRTNNDQDLIRKGREYARIELNSDENEYRVVINKKGKSLFIDGTLIRRTSEFIGRINAVLFKPSDLELFTQSPGERRKLLDIEISKVSGKYIDSLLRYNHLLKDKNRLLKEKEPDPLLMSVIEESMAPLIKSIIKEREEFFKTINEYISPMYAMISGKEAEIKIRYRRCRDRKSVV